ncbi:ammonium transporter [Humidisolicoccus flavus]|uniref:ammonium transporter n=1 Tax=Humidisolicoccus flavus TaxID=3111414 RepID=UPI003252772F
MSADIVWLLLCAALVLFMTPGLAFFYGGLVKVKSVVSMMMLSFGALALIGVLWVLYGFNINSITNTSADWIPGVFGNPFSDFALANADGTTMAGAAFGSTFAIITVALISGAIADRAKFGSWMIFAGIWATISYFPIAGWVWAVDADGNMSGWIGTLGEALFPGSELEVLDWAGGTAVHINAGAAALALALVLGKRVVFEKGSSKPHNVPLVMLGAAILWFGWFGFNTGAATDDNTAGLIFLNTVVTPAAGVLGFIAVERFKEGKATSVGAASGAVAGLVAITPACAALTPGWAIVLGLLAGAVCAFAIDLKFRLGFDDSLDVVGLHLVAGFIGCLFLGFFATGTGLFTGGDFRQLVLQLLPAVAVAIYSFVVAWVIGTIIEKTIGFRIKNEDEVAGIDTSIHGETGYALVEN